MSLIRRLHTQLFAQTVRKPQRRLKLRAPIAADVECLEDRTLLATFTVDNIGDVDDGDFTAGQQTLREAINQANATAGPDIIDFAVFGTIVLTGGQLPINEDLTINGPGVNLITIDGNDASRIFNAATGTIVSIDDLTMRNGLADGSGGAILTDGSLTLMNVVLINNEATANGGAVALGDMASSLTIANSSLLGNMANGQGGAVRAGTGTSTVITDSFIIGNTAGTSGAIHHQGMLQLIDSFVTDNVSQIAGGTITQQGGGTSTLIERTTFDDNMAVIGGGLQLTGGTATVIDSLFTDNQALFGSGGAIANNGGALTVERTTIDGNFALAFGGGIHTEGFGLTSTTIVNSTISGNTVRALGGGLSNLNGNLFVHNSTISGNSADHSGGGIMNEGGFAQIINSTITGNRADADDDGFGISKGGGIFSPEDFIGTQTQLINSIVVGNFYGMAGSDVPNDIADVLSFGSSNNVVGTPAFAGGLVDGANGNIIGDGMGGNLNPATVLNPVLANNGGPTRTHALVSGSPAIDAGNNALAVDDLGQPLVTDQRLGFSGRIQDGDGNGTFNVDAGAFEEQGIGFLVDTTADGIDGDITPGNLSLREAVEFANTTPGMNAIYFSPLLTGQTITLTDGVIDLLDDVMITGLGRSSLSISGGLSSQIFEITAATVRIQSLTLSDGRAIGGGAVHSIGADLTLHDVILTNNMELGPDGAGAVLSSFGNLTITESLLTGNGTGQLTGAGAVASPAGGDVSIIDSTIKNNQGGIAGGVYLDGGHLELLRTTVSENSAVNAGGLFLDSASFTITDSTISGNISTTNGRGGIGTISNPSPARVTNSTIANNHVSDPGGGGGLDFATAGVVLNNTIVIGNTVNGSANDINGPADATSSNNLIGDAATSGGLMDGDNGNIVGVGGVGTRDVNTVLLPLADNGGPTQTHALVPGSVAIDAGDDALAVDEMSNPLTTDQRGGVFNRFRDGDNNGTATVDMGAIESQVQILIVDTNIDESDGDFSPGDLSLREAIEEANAMPGFALIYFDPALTGQTILLTDGVLSVSGDVEIYGLGKTSLTVSGGDNSGVFTIADGLTVLIQDMAIVDGAATNGAGIFHGDGELTLNNILFAGNDATGSGGALFNDGGVVIATGVMIQNNSAAAAGGGVENVGGDVFLNGSMVDANTASVSGGGAHNTGTARLFIDGTTVTNNTAGEEGGGLSNSSSGILIIRNGSTVSGNTASGDGPNQGGGGIFNDGGGAGAGGGRLAIQSGSTISGNTADGLSGSGGGILTINGVVTVDDSAVTGNMANRAGGGIEMVTGIVELRNSNLDGNSALGGAGGPGNGGGLHVTGLPGQVGFIRVFGGTVNGNFAATEGGGLWNNVANIMVIRQGAVVDGNTASGDAADDGGGGVFNNNGRLSIGERVRITNNMANGAAGSGGGVFSTGSGLSIDNSTIDGNMAHRAGGGIEIIAGNAFLTNVVITNNDAGGLAPNPGNGGGLHVSGNAFTRIDGGIVIGNTAAREGGGLWNSADGVMLVRRSFTAAGTPETIREATGPSAGSIQGTVNAFRNDLGVLNPNDPGTTGFGRREINWDGAPDGVSAPSAFPGDFFNDNFNPLARGIELSTPGSGFQLSATLASGEGIEFDNINSTYSTAFSTFSAERLFTAIDSNVVMVNFFVPGTSQPALVDGFGVVFTDVDVFGSTMVEYFDVNGNLIATRTAMATPGNGGQSFVGLTFQTAKIASVRITSGDGPLGAGLDDVTQGGANDLVVMDDFIFGEPVPIGTLLDNNTASGDAADDGGGGIFNDGGRVAIFESFLSNNVADGDSGSGGGIFSLRFSTGAVTAQDTTIIGNIANRAGGGIEIVNGLMELTNTHLIGNSATGGGNGPGDGGGLHVTGNAARVNINGGTFSGNTADNEGGGVWNQSGSIMVFRGGTTIDGNTASGDALDAGGGGIFNNGGRLAITGTTISNNMADGTDGSGGGILSLGGGLTLDNSTVSGNTANGNGGGLVSNGNLIAANSTIALNGSDADGANGGTGGGLFNGGTATLNNTLVVGNEMGTGGQTSDIGGNNVRSQSRNNLISDAGSAGGLVDGVNGNIIGNGGAGILPVFNIIDPLGANGGQTLTHALVVNSLAIDAGDNSSAKDTNGVPFVTDQRGTGFPRINNGIVDMGSFEF